MLVNSAEMRRSRSKATSISVGVAIYPLLAIAGISGCSDPSGDVASRHDQTSEITDHYSDKLRLVQSGGAAPVEVIPTPSPDGVPEPNPATPPQKPPGTVPEMVPVPEGVPEDAADDTRAIMGNATPKLDHESTTKPALSVKDSMKRDALGENPGEVELSLDGPEDYRTWSIPDVAIIVTGHQHGYIEPCGCTGLDRQKGGVARRYTFMEQLRSQGWPLLPIDAGNQVRRFGRQSEIKFQQTAEAFKAMDYQMVGFGPDDVRLSTTELLAVVAADSADTALYASSNVIIFDSSLMPKQKVISVGGMRIGVTSLLDPTALEAPLSDDITIETPVESARNSLAELTNASTNYRVLTFFGKEEAASQLVRDVPGFDLVVVGGGFGEPTYKPQTIEGSATQMIVTGNKGMYAGIVGLYANQPMKYARVPLTHEFADAPEMRQLMRSYQDQLKAVGLEGLGLRPIPHPSGEKFVGTATCAECHTSAFEVWESSAHAEATAHIVEPPKERGDVARHFDPECISCHVTGWNAQDYYPYQSGYLSLEESQHLTGNGCENCHGPGASHSAAEREGSGISEEVIHQLRLSMKLPLEKAKEKCMQCHDLDNSPDFHVGDAFEDDYWPQVEHDGVD